MANEIIGPILGTVILAGVNGAGQPTRIDNTVLTAGLDSDGKAHYLLVDSSGNVLSSGGGVSLSNDSPVNVGTAAAGIGTEASRDDHVHAIPDQLVTSRMVNLTQSTVEVATEETTTSTSYVDLATVGPAITLTPGITQDHGIYVNCDLKTNVLSTPLASVAIAGAAASDVDAARHDGTALSRSSRWTIAVAQASGATHTMKYRVTSQTGTFGTRRILGIAL